MKKVSFLLAALWGLCGFTGLSNQTGGSFTAQSENRDWEVQMSGSSIKAYNQDNQLEVVLDIGNMMPSAPLCVSGDKIKDIKINLNIYKVAQAGEKNWQKAFEQTKIYFSRSGGSAERKVYGSSLIKDNLTFKEGTVVNVGSLTFLSPFVCNEVDGLRMRIIGMKAGYRNAPTLDFTIKVQK